MGNSTLVALALFALFLVYITARGRLPQYLAVFFGQVTSDQGGAAAAPSGGYNPMLQNPSGGTSSGAGGFNPMLQNPSGGIDSGFNPMLANPTGGL